MPKPNLLFLYTTIVLLTGLLFYSPPVQAQNDVRALVQNRQPAIRPFLQSGTRDTVQQLSLVRNTMRRATGAPVPLTVGKGSQPPVSPLQKQGASSRRLPALAMKGVQGTAKAADAICYVLSGREFLYQDSLILFTGSPTLTADGHVILSGEFADYSKSPLVDGGFCMKTDFEGNVLWAKLYDSTAHLYFDYLNLFQSIELKNGHLLLAGRTTNRVSGNDDFVLVKLDAAGNLIWTKTYAARTWQGFNGSGDYFNLVQLREDPFTGDLYFVGGLWAGASTITKVDPSDGHVIWSQGYDSSNSDYPFGIDILPDKLVLFQMEASYYGEPFVGTIGIRKSDGDTLFCKAIRQVGPRYAPSIYRPFPVVKQTNGHYLLSGLTTLYNEIPAYTGTVDLYHAAIIELDENFDFVKAYGFKNRHESNGYNTRVSLTPNGDGVFTMFDYNSPYTGEAYISLFQNDRIYHQRKRIHNNEGMPFESPMLPLPDGGWLSIKLMSDSTKTALEGSRIDYYRIHTSDTASACLGVQDSSASLWYLHFEPSDWNYPTDTLRHLFGESRAKQFVMHDFGTITEPACQVISHCDQLALQTDASIVCPGTGLTLTVRKNKECGSLVPLVYDTTWVKSVTPLSDTSFLFQFSRPGKGFIRGSLMGCSLRTDSVLINVVPAKSTLTLGKDTTICPGNSLVLNAGSGFVSYRWQDGSTDSLFTVTKPGLYYLEAANGCGGVFRDTLLVTAHPPIRFDAGPDRTKCNGDTLHLNATPGFISYAWGNDYKISSLTSPNVVVNPLVDTAYYIKAEKTPGCFAYDTVRVTVLHSPPIDLGADKNFCLGDSAVVNAGSGFQRYAWSSGQTAPQVALKAAGSYSVVATTTAGCKSYDTIRVVNVYPLPQPNLEQAISFCKGESKLLQPGRFVTYQWSTGEQSSSIVVNALGSYSVTVTDSHGCAGRDTTSVVAIHPLPAGFLPPDTAVCSYETLVLKPDRDYASYSWSTGANSAVITVTQPGLYWLQVQDRNHCIGKDSIQVLSRDCMRGFYVPTAFSPNHDGRNDLFGPKLFGNVRKYLFTVYNRWGQVIFQTKELAKGWDGKVAGVEQESSVFVWSCRYQLEGEAETLQQGTVFLIR